MNKEIILQLEISSGAILPSDIETGEAFTEFDIINHDAIICDLNSKIGTLYSSYFEFNSHDVACWFNKEAFNKDKQKIKILVEKLKYRIEELK